MINYLIQTIKQKAAFEQSMTHLRALTGLSVSELKKTAKELNCSIYTISLFYKSEQRFPTKDESKLIAEYGVNIVVFCKRIMLNNTNLGTLSIEEACKRMHIFSKGLKQYKNEK